MYKVRVRKQFGGLLETRIYSTKTRAIKGAIQSVAFFHDGEARATYSPPPISEQGNGYRGFVESADRTIHAHIWKLEDGDRIDL